MPAEPPKQRLTMKFQHIQAQSSQYGTGGWLVKLAEIEDTYLYLRKKPE